ncbi:hypothetical protein OGAPHI_007089 [Ogataea philodendri]|uniref:Uncharacterized protein n=1 Tax=Ogataea philodendri TaxID=1378263 RepID=A0A9P8NUC3_9ASCO|nr:uncharacterized protein OGAPHI_007089 [Ogataea philodendri]KAH3660503.1 hypothetical protein OGAPHI_007089 [Ogataea philodendri]
MQSDSFQLFALNIRGRIVEVEHDLTLVDFLDEQLHMKFRVDLVETGQFLKWLLIIGWFESRRGVSLRGTRLESSISAGKTSSPLFEEDAASGVGVWICGGCDCEPDFVEDVEGGEALAELSTPEFKDDCSEDADCVLFIEVGLVLAEELLWNEPVDLTFSGFFPVSSFLSFFFSPLADPVLDLNRCLKPFIILLRRG